MPKGLLLLVGALNVLMALAVCMAGYAADGIAATASLNAYRAAQSQHVISVDRQHLKAFEHGRYYESDDAQSERLLDSLNDRFQSLLSLANVGALAIFLNGVLWLVLGIRADWPMPPIAMDDVKAG